jgi:hypothetical protein
MTDLLLDADGDLDFEDGDLKVGFCDQQNQFLLLKLPKGAIKKDPLCTVGAPNYLEAEDDAAFLREIRNKFQEDGLVIKAIGFNNEGKLKINAVYK